MKMPKPLRDYQIADLSFLMAHERACLLHDPGGGKTPTVCVYMEWVFKTTGLPCIWVMPKSLLEKNIDEILEFSNIKREQIALVDGKNWKAELARRDVAIYVVGPTRFRISWKDFPKAGAVLADEHHKFWKSNKSAATQSLYGKMKSTPRFVGMTGTLINGRMDSAYPTIHVIEPRYYGSYQGFLNHHAVMDDFGNVLTWKNPQRVAEILSKHCIYRSFESVHGPESKVIITETCSMSPKQRAAYEEFETNAILELSDSFLTGATGGVHAIRCRQIMAHPETFGIGVGEPTGKDELLDVHLSHHAETGKPLVLFASLVPEQERLVRLVQAAGMTVGLMNGNVTGAKRSAIEKSFREGTVQVLVCSPAVADVGFNWSHVDTMIFVSLDYMDSTFFQAFRRAIRGKRATPLLIYVLEYRNSIEQRIFQIIERKSKMANSVDPNREVFSLSSEGT
jgi:superfamily II DNA or RNA helicase